MTTPTPVFAAARRRRTPLAVDLVRGRLAAGGYTASFDPTSSDGPYHAYLRLVRRMRSVQHEPGLLLRRDDVEALAWALDEDPVDVLGRLGTLLGAPMSQRRSMVTSFVAGALLIVVASAASVAAPTDGRIVQPGADIDLPFDVTDGALPEGADGSPPSIAEVSPPGAGRPTSV